MLQGANTDLFSPLVPKAYKSECQNLPFFLQIKQLKVPKAYKSEFQNLPFFLQIKQLKVSLKLSWH